MLLATMNHFTLIILCSMLHLIIAQTNDKKIVCYYTDWSVYRPDSAKFSPRDINPNICTHLIYAFAKFSDEGGIAPFDEWQDITRKGYSEFNEVKKLNENIRTLLAIGGWSEGSKTFSRIASLRDRRVQFADSVAVFLRMHNFDGINLDWQFPAFRDGSREEDFENYVELIKDLRMVFENETRESNQSRLMVTLSVPRETEYIEKGFDLLNLQRYADFINILSYDYHLSYDPNVNHHAPLYPLLEETGDHPNADLNVDSTIRYLLGKGMMREIINIGIPTFGRTFTLDDPNNNGLGAPATGLGQEGQATRERGYKAYYEICKEVRNDNWTVVYANRTAMGPYAYKGENWVGYDDEFIVRRKAEYARDMGLGGIMFWTIDDDDFRGECGSRGNPLIKAGREALLARPMTPPTPSPSTMNITQIITLMPPRNDSTPPNIGLPDRTLPPAETPLPGQSPGLPPPAQPPGPVIQPQPTPGQGLPPPPPPPPAPPVNIPTIRTSPPPVAAPPPTGSPVQPIQISREQQDGKNTYYQEITIWVVNNIFNFNF